MSYPTVTQIIAPYTNFSNVSVNVLNQAAERGTRVHNALRYYLLEQEHIDRIDDDIWSYYRAGVEWIDSMIKKVHKIEIRLSDNELHFSGQPDLICKLSGDKSYTLLDWKTSQSHQKTWALQIAAYRHLAQKNGIKTGRGMSIRLKRNGSGVLINEYDKCYYEDYHVFLGMLTAYNFIKPKAIGWDKI